MQKTNSRITVSDNGGPFKLQLKAKEYSLGNGFLTAVFLLAVTSSVVLLYLMFAEPAGYIYWLAGFVVCVLSCIVVARIWLWHHYGKEILEARDETLFAKRSYGIFETAEQKVGLGDPTKIFVNRTDKWNWRRLHRKGIIRICNNGDAVDFAVDSDDREYEMMVTNLNALLARYKMTPVKNQFNGDQKPQELTTPAVSWHSSPTDYTLPPIPPILPVQTGSGYATH